MLTKKFFFIIGITLLALSVAFHLFERRVVSAWSMEQEILHFEDTIQNSEAIGALMVIQQLKSITLYKTYWDFIQRIPTVFDGERQYVIIYRFAPNSSTLELLYIEFGSGTCSFISARHQPRLGVSGACDIGDAKTKSNDKWTVDYSFDGELTGLFVSDNGVISRKIMSTNPSNNRQFTLPENPDEVLSALQSLL